MHNHNDQTLFTTMSRKLEQVLYNFGHRFIRQEKDPDGMCMWTFRRTPELDSIVDMFRQKQRDKGIRTANAPLMSNATPGADNSPVA